MLLQFLPNVPAAVSTFKKSANFVTTQDPKKIRAVPSFHEIRSGLRHAGHHASNLLLSSSYHLSSGRTQALPDHLAAVANMGTRAISLRVDLAVTGRLLRGDLGTPQRSQRTGSMSRSQLNRSPRQRLPVPTARAVSLPAAARPSLGIRCGGRGIRALDHDCGVRAEGLQRRMPVG